MILSDRKIQEALESGQLVIEPRPLEEAYDPTSVDLTLDNEFFEWKTSDLEAQFGEIPAVNISSYDYLALAEAYLQAVQTDANGCVIIHPGPVSPRPDKGKGRIPKQPSRKS